MTSYLEFSSITKKANLINSLMRLAPWLTKGQMVSIAEINPIVSEESIVIHTNVSEFSRVATLNYYGTEHSWAGASTTRDFGWWVVGEGNFGENRNLTYSNNGDCSTEERYVVPEFNMESCNVILVKTEERNSLNNQGDDTEEWSLHILKPNSEFKVEPEIQAIIQEFGLG
jgi:hypothetical protein